MTQEDLSAQPGKELRTHGLWAENILTRAAVFGIRE